MKVLISTLILLFLNMSLNAQTDCDKLLAQKINLHDHDFEKMEHELIVNYSKLVDCGLNQEDITFLSQPPLLAALVISWINENPETVTYQKLLDEVLIMKATPDYIEMVKMFSDLQTLRSKKIDINNWETDSILISSFIKDERVVNSIYQLIANNLIQYETYGDMIDDFNKEADSFLSDNKPIEGDPDFHKDSKIISYDEMLEKSKASGKSLLIYFTSYSDVNSREMEDAYLYDNDIQEHIISKYYTITLYVDSKEEVPKEYIKTNSKTGKTMETYGYFYSKLQKKRFKNQSQPFFAIVNHKGKVLKTNGFTLDKNEFFKFIE